GPGLVRQFFKHRIRLHFLLHEIAQLKQRRLENEQALLHLRGEDLLQSKALSLLHSLRGHTPSLPAQKAASKQGETQGSTGCQPVVFGSLPKTSSDISSHRLLQAARVVGRLPTTAG